MPLSLPQRGLWILHQLDPSDTCYHTLLAFRASGPVNVPAMERALAAVIGRHEALRTSFPIGPDGEPYQRVHDASVVRVAVHDLRARPDRDEAALALVYRYQLEPYDLTGSPPVRCAVIRVSDTEAVVVIGTHHIVSDAMSSAVLLRDLTHHYRRAVEDTDNDMPPLLVQYADVALWQQERAATGGLGPALDYWRRHLHGITADFDPRALSPTNEGWGVDAGVTIEFPEEFTDRLRSVASSVNATPFMVVFAAWAIVVAPLYPGSRDDIVIGVPVDGRSTKVLQDLVGLFVTMVPVRVAIDTDQTFADLLATVRDILIEAYEHAAVPMDRIVRDLAPRRRNARTPLFEITCQLQHATERSPGIGSLSVEVVEPAPQQAKFQLSLNAVMTASATRLHIAYPRDRFPADAVDTLGEHLRTTLSRVVQDPTAMLSQLPILAAPGGALSAEPSPGGPATQRGQTMARSEHDTVTAGDIAAVFAETVGRAEVADTESFFDVGGHSLLALQLMRRLRHRYGENLPMNLVFAHSTARELASAIARAEPVAPTLNASEDILHDVGLWLGPLPAPAARPPGHVLVTGATGLMGAHVVAQVLESTLMTVWCLVRAATPEVARQRLLSTLQGTGRWHPDWAERVRVLRGDLSSPRMGLSDHDYAEAASAVDVVFHVAASTNLLDSYNRIRGPNVLGTREVLWFATTDRLKPVHYVSTVSTMRGGADAPDILPEYWRTSPGLLPDDGYVRSKWVAEETVRQAAQLGVPTAVYRTSRICGDVVSGSVPASDAFWSFVVACVEVGAEPDGDGWEGFGDRLVPADYLAAAFVRIALATPADGSAYTLTNPVPTTLAEVVDVARSLGHPIKRMPGDQWLKRVETAARDPHRRSRALESVLLLSVMALRQDPTAGRPVSTARADVALDGTGIVCPPVDTPLVKTYLRALTECGALPNPPIAVHPAKNDLAEVGTPGLWKLWEHAVRTWPRRPAAVDASETVTFAELDRRAAVVAAGLAARGIEPGDRVGIRLRHEVSLLATLLGVVRVGATFVPVDHRQDDDRSRGILRRARVKLTVADSDTDDPSAITPDILMREGDGLAAPPPTTRDVAYVLFTSGSTGEPKGVVVPHSALSGYLAWVRKEYVAPRPQGAPLYSSVAFDLTITSMFGPLVSGGAVHLIPPHGGIIRVAEVLCEGALFDFIKLTPTHLRMLIEQLKGRLLTGHATALVVGGEPLPADLVRAWWRISPSTVIYNEYGPTEVTVGCCVHRIAPDAEVPQPIPIGLPIPGVHLRVVNQAGQEASPGDIGELVIGGSNVAWGYDRQPQETARRFVADDWGGSTGARSYLTGDLVQRSDDGVFTYVGRADQQVKIRGYRVELNEVAVTLRSLDGIRDCIIRPFTRGDDTLLVAYVVGDGSAADVPKDLRARARLLLPEYMLPTEFVFIEEVPTTLNGKIDTGALPEPADLGDRHASAGAKIIDGGSVRLQRRSREEELYRDMDAGRATKPRHDPHRGQ